VGLTVLSLFFSPFFSLPFFPLAALLVGRSVGPPSERQITQQEGRESLQLHPDLRIHSCHTPSFQMWAFQPNTCIRPFFAVSRSSKHSLLADEKSGEEEKGGRIDGATKREARKSGTDRTKKKYA